MAAKIKTNLGRGSTFSNFEINCKFFLCLSSTILYLTLKNITFNLAGLLDLIEDTLPLGNNNWEELTVVFNRKQ